MYMSSLFVASARAELRPFDQRHRSAAVVGGGKTSAGREVCRAIALLAELPEKDRSACRYHVYVYIYISIYIYIYNVHIYI